MAKRFSSTYVPLPIGARLGAAMLDVFVLIAASPAVIAGLEVSLECGQGCLSRPAVWLLAVFAIFAYVLLFWVAKLATPGKIALRAIIVDAETGADPSPLQFVKRYLGLIASVAVLGLGFLPIFFTPSRQAFHDTFSHTMVVREREMATPRRRLNIRFVVLASLAMIVVCLLFFLIASVPYQVQHSFASLVDEPVAFLTDEQFAGTCLSLDRQAPTKDRDLLEKHIMSAREAIDGARGRRSSLEVARSSINAALSIDPCYAPAYREQARYFERVAKIESDPEQYIREALRSISRAIGIDPRYADAYVLQGFIAHLSGDDGLATESLDRAEALGSTDPWLHINRGLIKRDAGNYSGAAVDYRKAIDSGTDDKKAVGAAMDGVAEYFQHAGQLPQADEVYATRVAFDPESALGHLRYARFLLCYMDDAERSLGEVAKAAELARGAPQIRYIDVMAANYVRQWAQHTQKGGLAAERMAPKLLHQASNLADGQPLDVMSAVCKSSPAYEKVRDAVAEMPIKQLAEPASLATTPEPVAASIPR